MIKSVWQERSDGAFVAHRQGFDLTVYRRSEHELVQFTVAAQDKAIPCAIIGSGLAPDIGQAMKLADGMARRFRQDAPAGRSQVMVVNDDTAVRGVLADALRNDGYKVIEATNAEGALRRLTRIRYPIAVITDFDLGAGMNGLELVATVHNRWPTIGALLIKGEQEEVPDDSVATIGLLPKPVSIEHLLERVGGIFSRLQSSPAATSSRAAHR